MLNVVCKQASRRERQMEAVHPGQTGVSYGKKAGRWEEMLGGAQLYFMNISGVEAGKLGVIGNFLVSVLSVLDG